MLIYVDLCCFMLIYVDLCPVGLRIRLGFGSVRFGSGPAWVRFGSVRFGFGPVRPGLGSERVRDGSEKPFEKTPRTHHLVTIYSGSPWAPRTEGGATKVVILGPGGARGGSKGLEPRA